MAKHESAAEPAAVQAGFGKAQILKMKRYANRADLLGVLLEPGETYTLGGVDALMEAYLKKGKVK